MLVNECSREALDKIVDSIISTSTNEKVILVVGPHHGDVIWSTAHISSIIEKHQNTDIIVCCYPKIDDVFAHSPKIRKIITCDKGSLIPLTIRLGESKAFQAVIPPVIIWPIGGPANPLKYSSYLAPRGYKCNNIKPDLYISDDEIDSSIRFISNHKGPKALIELFSYSKQTAFTMQWFRKASAYLIDKGFHILVPCSPTEAKLVPKHDKITCLDNFTVRQCGFLVNFCQIMLSVSSGVSHACSSNLAKEQLVWVESINTEHFSTRPYGIPNRVYHVGTEFDDYFKLLKSVI